MPESETSSGPPIKTTRSWSRLKKWGVTLGVLLVTLVVWLRWPRLSDGGVTVTRCEYTSKSVMLEFRATVPFDIEIDHDVEDLSGRPPMTSGILVYLPKYLHQSRVAERESRYDWFRGEHVVEVKIMLDGQVHDGEQTAVQLSSLVPSDINFESEITAGYWIGFGNSGYVVTRQINENTREQVTWSSAQR